MSVSDRIIDAKVLYANGRKDGALLSILVAVAATSRKRYPKGKLGDREAFITFVGDEMKTITGVVQNFNLKFRNKMIPLEDLLYKFMRCNLAHEATLPNDIRFDSGNSLKVSVNDDLITFSDVLIDGLATAVINAPENAEEFRRQN